MVKAYSSRGCKGPARNTGEVEGSVKEATVVGKAVLLFAGRHCVFVSEICTFCKEWMAMSGSPGAQEAADAPRATDTSTRAAGESRGTMGEQAEAPGRP